MRNLFSFIFYIRRSKADKNGRANVYLRITVNGKRVELSISKKSRCKKINIIKFTADWIKYGKAAGIFADALIAF
ncbi:Arm DNA-binding domain-containing protein [Polaribacter sp. OB-PA-B3]